MATWIVNIRIAEKLLAQYDLDPASFLAGNIGPDSGVPNENRTSFDPPKSITHWVREDAIHGKDIVSIHDREFYSKYLEGLTDSDLKGPRNSFLLGYYVHLLTDIEWSKMVNLKISLGSDFGRRFRQDPQFIWEVKKDWYGLDFKYLKDNADSIYHTVFSQINGMPDYLDYFPQGAIIRQIRYIQDFYGVENDWVNKEFNYLTEDEMDAFVRNTVKVVLDLLHSLMGRTG